MRQLNITANVYKQEHKGYAPFATSKKLDGTLEGWATWTWVGKNCSTLNIAGPDGGQSWPTQRIFDPPAKYRLLNPYVTDEGIEGPTADSAGQSAWWSGTYDSTRERYQLEVAKDPSDKITYQRRWPAPTFGISGYDSEGNSYHYNVKWWEQLGQINGFEARFRFGMERMKTADAFNSSKFVWCFDQYADIVIHDTNPRVRRKNGFDDVNKSVMAFMDGHCAYLTTTPGANAEAYSNERYTLIFTDLRIPR